jgi:hypothetical protein
VCAIPKGPASAAAADNQPRQPTVLSPEALKKFRQFLKSAPVLASGSGSAGRLRRRKTAFFTKKDVSRYRTERKWCKLLKRIFTKRRFPQMFVKNTVDEMGKSGYDGNRN